MKLSPPIAVAVLVVLALAGCTPDDPVVIPEPDPTSAPIFESDEEALAAAEVAYGEYLKVSDQIYADGGRDPQRIELVASDDQALLDKDSFQEVVDRGTRGTGNTTFDRMELQQYDSGSQTGLAVVSVYSCLDLSGTDTLDATGKSVVGPNRPSIVPVEIVFDLQEPSSATLVVSSQDIWSGDDFCAS